MWLDTRPSVPRPSMRRPDQGVCDRVRRRLLERAIDAGARRSSRPAPCVPRHNSEREEGSSVWLIVSTSCWAKALRLSSVLDPRRRASSLSMAILWTLDSSGVTISSSRSIALVFFSGLVAVPASDTLARLPEARPRKSCLAVISSSGLLARQQFGAKYRDLALNGSALGRIPVLILVLV